MTAPGAIQPLNNVPTAPMYFAQSPGLAQQLAPTTRLLLEAIQQHQAQQELARQHDMMGQSGQVYNDILQATSTPSVLGGTIAPVPGLTAAPIAVKPNLLADRLGAATRNRPGEVVLTAGKAASNEISQAIKAEQDQRDKARPKPPVLGQGLEHYVNDKGELLVLDKNSRRAAPAIDERTGLPVMAPKPDPTQKGRWVMTSYVDPVSGLPMQTNTATGDVRIAPADMVKPISPVEASSAAMFYREAAEAWKQVAALGPSAIVPADAASFILNIRGATGTSAAEKYIRDSSLSDTAKRSMLAWATIIRGSIYSKSGKAVTLQEFQDALNRGIPTGLDSPELRQSRIAFLQAYTDGVYGKARGWFQTEKRQDPNTEIPPAPYDLFQGIGHGLSVPANPVSGQPFKPGNPFLSPQTAQPGAGTVLAPARP